MRKLTHVSKIDVSLWGKRVGALIPTAKQGYFSFMRKQGEDWSLAPAYDLTGAGYPSNDPWSAHAGRHQLSVNGKFENIEAADLIALAERFAIGTGESILKEVFAVVQ